jgi:amino acid transporter
MPTTGEPPAKSPPTPELRRALGFRDVVLFFITAGINLQWVATASAAGPSAITIWFIAFATMAVPLALTIVELSSRYPDEGGMYIWTKKAFGEFAAFMTGWTYGMSNLPYFPGVLYFAAANALYIGGAGWRDLSASPAYFILASLLGLALGTLPNLFGLQFGKWLSNIGAYARWAATLGLIVLGGVVWLRFGPATEFNLASLTPGLDVKNLLFWSSIAFALTGLEAASFMGEEIKNARRTIPRALFTAVPLITLTYVLGTIGVLAALPAGQASGLQGPIVAIDAAGRRLGLSAVTPVAAFLIALSALGSVGAWLAAVARLPFVAGLDHLLPESFGRVHPRWRTPHVALLSLALVIVACVLLSQAGQTVRGAYDILVSMTVICTLIPFLFLFASMVRLQREPAGPEVFRAFGGSRVAVLAGVVGFLVTAVSIVLSFFPAADEPHKTLAVAKILGLTILSTGSGVVVYWIRRRRRRSESGRP